MAFVRCGTNVSGTRALGFPLHHSPLGLIKNGEDLICFRLHFLAVETDDPHQLRLITTKLNLNVVHEGLAATPVIAGGPSHVFGKFTFAINYGGASTR